MTIFNNGESGSSVRTKLNAVLQHTDGTAGELVINDAGADVDFRVESDTNANALFLDGASGNLGLGVVPSAWTAGIKSIDINNAGSFYADGSAYDWITGIAQNAYQTGNNTWAYRFTGITSARYQMQGATHQWFTAPSGTAGAAITFTQAMTLDASGNLGVGTTSPNVKLDVNGNAQLRAGGYLLFLNSDNTNSYFLQNSGATGSGNPVLDFVQGGIGTRLRIDSAGNVGIGTSNPRIVAGYASLGINGSTGSLFDLFSNGTRIFTAGAVAGEAYVQTATAVPLTFGTNGTERLRIDSNGNLLVGTTTANGNGWTVNPNGSGQIRSSGTGSEDKIQFANGNGVVGAITTSGTATSYNTSSDYRLKEDLQPIAEASSRLAALNPVNFAWKADGTRTDGFIAHEVQAVIPQAVTGKKDATDEDGNPVYQGIDQSKIVPLLTAALQEALAKIAALEARVGALES